MREVGGGGRDRVPAVQETVIFEAAATEQSLVGVQSLSTSQWRYTRAAGNGQREGGGM